MLMKNNATRQALFTALCLCLLFGLSSCGKTGDLYLPDDKPGKTAKAG